jgi:endonuclease/exonuclease/phosphatase family metal-dependent hydrolase
VLVASLAAAGGVRAETVRLATFNVQNYLAMDRVVEGRFRPAWPKPEREKAAVREIVRAVRPDVLALQEIGPLPYLEELRQDLEREGWAFPFSAIAEAADAERHLAVLSRLPFAEVVVHREIEFPYLGRSERVKRGLLEIAFASGAGEGGAWRLFVVHLKSRWTDAAADPESAQRRLLEARALRDVVLARFPDPSSARFAIVGDFNDSPDSKTLAAFRARGRTRIATLLPAADSRGETWTHLDRSSEVCARVDFLLVSAALERRIVGARGWVHDGPGALDGSDHRLVYADFGARPGSETASPPPPDTPPPASAGIPEQSLP